jgi:hypothetical protein
MNPWGYRAYEVTVQTYPGQPSVETLWKRRRRCYQKAPFNLALPYYLDYGEYSPGFTNALGSNRHDALNLVGAYLDNVQFTLMANRAYDNFRNKIYEKVQLGVDFAELRKSYAMITSAASALIGFTRSVRRLEFERAAKALKMRAPPRGVRKDKNWSSNWLEYFYGWSPLVKTIYDSCGIANEPVKVFKAIGGAQTVYQNGSWNENAGSVTSYGSWWSSYDYRQGGQVKSIDADTFTLAQLGLTNPYSIAWELIPFSFVVDWFLNVGQMLETLSDFKGMILENTFHTQLYRNGEVGGVKLNPGFSSSSPPRYFSGTSMMLRREQGLTQPAFAIKKIALPSKTRALTAVALLNQVLGGKKA